MLNSSFSGKDAINFSPLKRPNATFAENHFYLKATVLLITPPFTQLNTPYPATAYLKGFLNTKKITSFQADLGIEITLKLFSKKGLQQLFETASKQLELSTLSDSVLRMMALKEDYIHTIDAVIAFLQGRNPSIAQRICARGFLPEGTRFQQLDDLAWAFGSMGFVDKAKHLATMYLEDLADFISTCIDPHFGFSRYAEKLGRSANSFDELAHALELPHTYVDALLVARLDELIALVNPLVVALSVPFPGNLYTSLRCGQWIKKHHPHIKVAMGGGFANTELRSVSDPRVFQFYNFITLDDGEAPFEHLIAHVLGHTPLSQLKRTFTLVDNQVVYIDNKEIPDYKQGQVGTPDYSDLLLHDYIDAIEIANPMHSLWSNGRWAKLTMAHGCYWGKCTFCDLSLDYIQRYEPLTAQILCDRMETVISQTGLNGFHFVDEAAPPALMRALSLEIIRRKLVVNWWTNIRFEKSFTLDLCLLLKSAGCIAVSGGLEVASDRLLQLIDKGISVSQVARVNRNFTEAGIMVHAYLMYGFPTQTAQETIDSLEMVRQMFKSGVLQSAFWHQFALTAHSPVGMNPEKYGIKKTTESIGSFANNDIEFIHESGVDHDAFGFGLKKALLNFMHQIGLEEPIQKWFDFKVPKTKITPDFIVNALLDPEQVQSKPNSKIVFIGQQPTITPFTKSKKGQQWEMATLTFHTKQAPVEIKLDLDAAKWLVKLLSTVSVNHEKIYTLQDVKTDYESAGLADDFELFWDNKPINQLNKVGLLRL